MIRRCSGLRGACAGLLLLAAPLAAQTPGALTPAPPAHATPLTVEQFAQLPFLADPLLSPDGNRIAARLMVGGQQRIGIWTLSTPRDQPPALIDASDIESFSWASDTRLLFTALVTLRLHINGVNLPIPARRLLVHNLDSHRTMMLGTSAGLVDELVFTDPAGRYVLLTHQDAIENPPSVHRVDLTTGESVEVQPEHRGVWGWFADANGVIRVGVDYGERRTRIYYRPTPGAELRLVESRRNLVDNSVVDAVRFVTDTNRGVIVTNSETGRFGVYEYDFATDTRGAVLFENPEVDATAAVFGADGRVDGVAYEDDRPHVTWLNPTLAQLQQRIDRALPGKTNMIVNRSRDGNRVLVFSGAADDPGTYYVYDQAARRMEIFASPYDDLEGGSFAQVRPIRYQSRDGLAIRGYLTLPAGRPERGLPLVVLPHGGPFLRDSWEYNPEVQFLASLGYAVLQPNYRGSTGYGRDFVERGYGAFGTGMIDDIEDGIDWLTQQGIADPARVCIMGSSYGGYAALWAATRSPQRYRCAISFAGPSDLRAMLRYDVRSYVPQRYVRQRRLEIQGEERTDLEAVSPLRQAARLTVPVLIAHGEQDVRVPVAQSRDLVRALTRRHAEVESVFYPKSAHGFTTPEESADFLRRVEAFLARHNPAQGAPPTETQPPASGSAGLSISQSSR